MMACDELEGRPSHQVRRFQAMAPMRPASTTQTNAGSAAFTLTRLDTVFATPWWKMKSARKLKLAAHTTALPGDRSRVETMVAIEFAASWKPLIKSKARATTTVRITIVLTSTI